LTDKADEIISKGDQIRITTTDPIDEVLGLPIYEAIHVRSNQRLLVTTSEITK
jgi:hypothetical protein